MSNLSYKQKSEQHLESCFDICTGEKVAGFKDLKTDKFIEVMLIKDRKDMDIYLEKYDISVAEIRTEY